MLRPLVALVMAGTLLAPAIVSAGGRRAGDPIHGVWIRGGHDDELEFFDCSGKLCARSLGPIGQGAAATLILRYAEKVDPRQWKGDLFNPQDGQIYHATVALDGPEQLTLTGCLGDLVCQSETWRKTAPNSRSAKGR